MTDYIDRQIAKEYLASDYAYSAANMLDELPAANVREITHGLWLSDVCDKVPIICKPFIKMRKKFRCSICGKYNGRKRSKYCPECGTKMKVEEM